MLASPSGPSVTFDLVAGKTVKTEAIVLRSIRYGEADRILHLYSKTRGRLGAIAKGARKPRSRFGGRLEPFFRLDLMLHEGRGDLMTVTGVSTIDGYPRLRSSGPALTAGARACDAALRLSTATGTLCVGTFHPLTSTTGVSAPGVAAPGVAKRAVKVSDSPGHCVTSLSLHRIGRTGSPPVARLIDMC